MKAKSLILGDDKFVARAPLQSCPGFICKGTNQCLPKKRRCDKIVDCLFADDEMDCQDDIIHEIFKPSFATNMVGSKHKGAQIDKDIDILDSFLANDLNEQIFNFIEDVLASEEEISSTTTLPTEKDDITSTRSIPIETTISSGKAKTNQTAPINFHSENNFKCSK